MITNSIIKYLEEWAPPGAAWEKDNVGLQVGSREADVKNILLCLELTENVLQYAISKKCNFIFTHHPFIFRPLKNIDTTSNPKAKIIHSLIKNDISLFSAHTNLDFTGEGTSFELASRLGIKNTRFLEYEKENQYKVSVFAERKYVDVIASAVFSAGGGVIGEYSHCSFSSAGMGTFKGSEASKPTIGEKEIFETVEEAKIEILVHSWKLKNVLNAIKEVHPYEEPAIDIYPVINENKNYGNGVVGEIDKALPVNEFLKLVSTKLKNPAIKYCKGNGKKIKKIAVCGGSGADLINAAISQKVDAFVTADIKYHTFQDAENVLLLIDAGHYETEILVLDIVKKKLESFITEKNADIDVIKYSGTTNPIKTYNNINRSK